MGQAFGLCPKCLRLKPLTKHHVHPKRHFKRSKAILHLCRSCHDHLEHLISWSEHNGRMEKKDYTKVAINFMRGGKE